MARPPLALVLLHASRWFDQRLRAQLVDHGWPHLSAAQSLVFAQLPDSGLSPAELARRLGTSRQAASELIAGLVQLDLLALVPDPTRRRGRIVRLTTTGCALAAEAGRILAVLEHTLDDELVRQMHTALSALDPAVSKNGTSVPS